MSNQKFAEELIAEILKHEALILADKEDCAVTKGYALAHKHIIEIIQDKARREF